MWNGCSLVWHCVGGGGVLHDEGELHVEVGVEVLLVHVTVHPVEVGVHLDHLGGVDGEGVVNGNLEHCVHDGDGFVGMRSASMLGGWDVHPCC